MGTFHVKGESDLETETFVDPRQGKDLPDI
jgi:hypothetical protein